MLPLMICDDEVVSVNPSVDYFEYFGRQVEVTQSADECLRKAQGRPYAAFIVDMDLGIGKTGIDLAKELSTMPYSARSLIIGISGHTQHPEVETGRLLDDFIKKPLVPRLVF